MTRGRWLTVAVMVVLLAAPLAAQQGGRGQARAGVRSGVSMGRQAVARPSPGRGQISRSPGHRAQPARPMSAAPGTRRVTPSGRDARTPGVRSVGPAVRAPGPAGGRRYDAPIYRGRTVVGRAVPRSYAQHVVRGPVRVAPRYGAAYHGPHYPYARPYGYQLNYRYAPRYVARGWRGGSGSHVMVVPRYVHPRVVGMAPYRRYFYRPSIGIGVFYGVGGFYPFGAIPPVYYDPAPETVLGGVRIVDAPRDAQVFVDGAFAGIVDDFDGAGEHLNLEPGRHRIEIHTPAGGAFAFDVDVQPGRTLTLRAGVF